MISITFIEEHISYTHYRIYFDAVVRAESGSDNMVLIRTDPDPHRTSFLRQCNRSDIANCVEPCWIVQNIFARLPNCMPTRCFGHTAALYLKEQCHEIFNPQKLFMKLTNRSVKSFKKSDSLGSRTPDFNKKKGKQAVNYRRIFCLKFLGVYIPLQQELLPASPWIKSKKSVTASIHSCRIVVSCNSVFIHTGYL